MEKTQPAQLELALAKLFAKDAVENAVTYLKERGPPSCFFTVIRNTKEKKGLLERILKLIPQANDLASVGKLVYLAERVTQHHLGVFRWRKFGFSIDYEATDFLLAEQMLGKKYFEDKGDYRFFDDRKKESTYRESALIIKTFETKLAPSLLEEKESTSASQTGNAISL